MAKQVFQSQIQQVEDQVAEMVLLARGMLRDGLHALVEGKPSLADKVVSRAKTLAHLDDTIEASALGALMHSRLANPEMRRVASILKSITYTNRVGRYGYDIAQLAIELPRNSLPALEFSSLESMAANVDAMLDLVLSAFRDNRVPDIDRLVALEEQVDAQNYVIGRQCIAGMMANSSLIEAYSNNVLVARYLERCGDNIIKMAEKQHFCATGERISLQ